jgi:hypothetical protein
LGEGAHTAAAYARLPGAGYYQQLAPTRLFFLTSLDGRFSDAFLRALGRAPRVAGNIESAGVCRGVASMTHGIFTADSGAVLVVTGRIVKEPRGRRFSAVWLFADGRPYPALYNDRSRSFVGTVPTTNLAPEMHRVFAYAIQENAAGNDRISQGLTFRIVPGPGETEFLRDPPTACADPLRQLAGA